MEFTNKKKDYSKQKTFDQQSIKSAKWSGEIDVDVIGSVDFVLQDENNNRHMLKATISQEKSIIFLIIQELPSNAIPYKVKCLAPEVSATFYQKARKGIQNYYELNDSNRNGVCFAWDRPHKSHEIKLLIKFSNKQYDNSSLTVNMDKINQVLDHSLYSRSRKSEVRLILTTVLENNTRVLKIFTSNHKELKQDDEEHVNLQINFKIKSFGLSFITSSFNRRRELLFLHVGDIEVLWIQTSLDNIYQMRAKTMHIDYNSYSRASYPVVFTPVDIKEIKEGKKYFFDILVSRRITDKDVIPSGHNHHYNFMP